MKIYVEGKISTEKFWSIYQEKEMIHKLLIKSKCLTYSLSQMTSTSMASLQDRISIYTIIKKYLKIKRYKFIPYNIDEEKYNFAMEIAPDWLLIFDVDFLNNIVETAPNNMSKEETKRWCENKLVELFKYDKYPPEWLTAPEWPIVNGKPLFFREMIGTLNGELITNVYIFYNQDTKEEVIISQQDFR